MVLCSDKENSGNKTTKLLEEIFNRINTIDLAVSAFSFSKDGIVTLNTIPIGKNSFLGLTVTYREWVNEIKPQQIPVFSNGFEGRGGKYRIAITYPIVNNNTGEYLGIVGMLIHSTFFLTLWRS